MSKPIAKPICGETTSRGTLCQRPKEKCPYHFVKTNLSTANMSVDVIPMDDEVLFDGRISEDCDSHFSEDFKEKTPTEVEKLCDQLVARVYRVANYTNKSEAEVFVKIFKYLDSLYCEM